MHNVARGSSKKAIPNRGISIKSIEVCIIVGSFQLPFINKHVVGHQMWQDFNQNVVNSNSYICKPNPIILPCISFQRINKIIDAHWKSGCNSALKHSDPRVINYGQVLLLAFVTNTHIKGMKCKTFGMLFSKSCPCHLVLHLCTNKIKTLMDFKGKSDININWNFNDWGDFLIRLIKVLNSKNGIFFVNKIH